jgi:hypothetical protein
VREGRGKHNVTETRREKKLGFGWRGRLVVFTTCRIFSVF